MLIYHGSEHVIRTPVYNGSKRTNDYGYGFYTTEDIELAKEWACARNVRGYANIYEFDIDELNVLQLNSSDYSILNWLAMLTRFRTYWQQGSISEKAKEYLQENFYIDPTMFDVIIGYRADDSYFSFAKDFVSNAISLRKLSEAIHLGKLGEQIVLKSPKAFEHLEFIGIEEAEAEIYYEKKTARDKNAKYAHRTTRLSESNIDDIYMIDIMREGMKNGDPRLR